MSVQCKSKAQMAPGYLLVHEVGAPEETALCPLLQCKRCTFGWYSRPCEIKLMDGTRAKSMHPGLGGYYMNRDEMQSLHLMLDCGTILH